jgi:hypothetical protein
MMARLTNVSNFRWLLIFDRVLETERRKRGGLVSGQVSNANLTPAFFSATNWSRVTHAIT